MGGLRGCLMAPGYASYDFPYSSPNRELIHNSLLSANTVQHGWGLPVRIFDPLASHQEPRSPWGRRQAEPLAPRQTCISDDPFGQGPFFTLASLVREKWKWKVCSALPLRGWISRLWGIQATGLMRRFPLKRERLTAHETGWEVKSVNPTCYH